MLTQPLTQVGCSPLARPFTVIADVPHLQVYEIRSVHKHLWRQVILPLEDEFRKPSFQTIQTAIVILTSRPAINVAQNHIAMGRVSCTPDPRSQKPRQADEILRGCRSLRRRSCSDCTWTLQPGGCRQASALSANDCGGRCLCTTSGGHSGTVGHERELRRAVPAAKQPTWSPDPCFSAA